MILLSWQGYFPIQQEGKQWEYQGLHIDPSRKDTISYLYKEKIVGREKIDGREYYILESLSTGPDRETQTTPLRIDSSGVYAHTETFGEIKYYDRQDSIWYLFPDTVLVSEGDRQIKFCGIGLLKGREKIQTAIGTADALILDHLYSQELSRKTEKGSYEIIDNKHELHRMWIVENVGVVKSVEIDAVGNKRIELLKEVK